MKLKFLLMPVSVLIALILIIWYIYPTWFGLDTTSIKTIRGEIIKNQKDLSDIENKKSNIISLTQSINSGSEIVNMVMNYYPTSRRDEDVITNINNIAFGEGVYLEDMDITYEKMDGTDDPIKIMALKPIEKIVVPSDSAVVVADPAQIVEQESLALNSKINFVDANLVVNGTYDQIRRFLISLNKMGLLNNVQSFTISKNDVKATDGKEGVGNPDLLKGEVSIGFGYADSSKEDVSSLLYSPVLTKSDFNYFDIEKNKTLLVDNYQRSDVGDTGLANPFIP